MINNILPLYEKNLLKSPILPEQISIIMPTYNEANNIIPLIIRILTTLGPKIELIVVDDNSFDGTSKKITYFATDFPQIKLITRKYEKGLTSAIIHGITKSTRPILIWMDCDLSMSPENIPALLKALTYADLALGSRYKIGGKDLRYEFLGRLLSRIICYGTKTLLGGKILDLTSGFLAIRRYILENTKLYGVYGEYCIKLIYYCQRHEYLIKEIPYICFPRYSGESKTSIGIKGFIKKGPGYLNSVWDLLKLNK